MAAVDGLALSFGGSAGSRAEVPGLDVGPQALPALTMGCWARAEAGFGAGFAGSRGGGGGSAAGGHLRSLLSGSAASAFDRAVGLRAWGSSSSDGAPGPAGWALNTGHAPSQHEAGEEEEEEEEGGNSGSGVLPVRYGQWSFVAAVYDQATRTAMLYVDGATVNYGHTQLSAGRGLGLLLGGSGTHKIVHRYFLPCTFHRLVFRLQ
jgi:hypothetical protein